MLFGNKPIRVIGTIGNCTGHTWHNSLQIFNISAGNSSIAKVVASDKTIIYQNSNLVKKWEDIYFRSLDLSTKQTAFSLARAGIERTLRDHLLSVYDVYPKR